MQTDATTPKVVGQQCCVRLHYGELENGSRSAARLVGFVLLSSFAANHKAYLVMMSLKGHKVELNLQDFALRHIGTYATAMHRHGY